MTVLAEQFIESFRRLPKDEQLEVARTIQAELNSSSEVGVSDEDLIEAEKRLEEYRRDPSAAIPHDQVRARLKSLL